MIFGRNNLLTSMQTFYFWTDKIVNSGLIDRVHFFRNKNSLNKFERSSIHCVYCALHLLQFKITNHIADGTRLQGIFIVTFWARFREN